MTKLYTHCYHCNDVVRSSEDAAGRRGVPEAAANGDTEGPGSDPGGARGSAALTSACTAVRRASQDESAAATATGSGRRRGRRDCHGRCCRRWISHLDAENRCEVF